MRANVNQHITVRKRYAVLLSDLTCSTWCNFFMLCNILARAITLWVFILDCVTWSFTEWTCSSFSETSSDTSLLLFTVSLEAVFLLTPPLLPHSLAFFWSWEVLQDLGTDHYLTRLIAPLSPFYHPNERPHSFNFQKGRWDYFAFTWICTLFPQRNTLLFLFTSCCALYLFGTKSDQILHFLRPRQIPALSPVVFGSKRSGKERQANILASQHASSVIAKAKAKHGKQPARLFHLN